MDREKVIELIETARRVATSDMNTWFSHSERADLWEALEARRRIRASELHREGKAKVEFLQESPGPDFEAKYVAAMESSETAKKAKDAATNWRGRIWELTNSPWSQQSDGRTVWEPMLILPKDDPIWEEAARESQETYTIHHDATDVVSRLRNHARSKSRAAVADWRKRLQVFLDDRLAEYRAVTKDELERADKTIDLMTETATARKRERVGTIADQIKKELGRA